MAGGSVKRYMVTGGAGFLGSHLCNRLLDAGHAVQCLDDLSTGRRQNIAPLESRNNFEFINHDLTKSFFPDNLDGIYNLASPASPVHYQYNPIRTLKMGTLAIYNVLGMATRLKVPILQTSTSEIYGDPLEHPQSESYWGHVNPIGPRACYDEGKRVAESLCVAYQKFNGVSIRIARIFNTYGPHMDARDGRVVSNFIVQALQGRPLTVYGDGKQTRSFCYVNDLIDGLVKLMDSNFEEPVNIGNPHEITILELAEEVRKVTGTEVDIVHNPLPGDDPQRRCPDISRAWEELRWAPQTELRNGLKPTIEWFKDIIK
jgi:UDP-glucuronate decarboxylase